MGRHLKVTADSVLTLRGLPAWSADLCDRSACGAKAVILIERGGNVLGQFCAKHRESGWTDAMEASQELLAALTGEAQPPT